MIRWIVLHKFLYTIPELVRLQQQQLYNVEANLRLITFVFTQRQTQYQSVQCDDIVFPNQIIDCVHTIVDVHILVAVGHLEHQMVA